MRKKLLVFGAAVAGVVGAGAILWLRSGPDPSQFAALTTPRFARLSSQRMLVVDAVGDPTFVSGKAIALLFKAYFKTDGVSRMQAPPAPRARWSFSPDTPRSKWIGQFALPIGDKVTSASTVESASELNVTLKTWDYGDVAEVVHIGAYSNEEADIARLNDFIKSSGYRSVGEHEEEYVRGPGMVFTGDPQKYITIIRVRVVSAPQNEEGTLGDTHS